MVAGGASDERVAVVTHVHRVTVVAPVGLDELVLTLDVRHVRDEEDASIRPVVGLAVGQRGSVGHASPDDPLTSGQRVTGLKATPGVRTPDVRAQGAPHARRVVAVVERVHAGRIEAQVRIGLVRRERER